MTNLYRNVFEIEHGRRTGPCGTAAKVLPICAPGLAEAEWIWLPVKLPGVIKYVFGLGEV
jgi:hypothetical protein